MAERLLVEPASFTAWVSAVERRLERQLGIKLADVPDLSLLPGYEVGDTPAEFVAGTVCDILGINPHGE